MAGAKLCTRAEICTYRQTGALPCRYHRQGLLSIVERSEEDVSDDQYIFLKVLALSLQEGLQLMDKSRSEAILGRNVSDWISDEHLIDSQMESLRRKI